MRGPASRRAGRRASLWALAPLALASAALLAPVAHAQQCANEGLRGQDAYSLALPDCRAYEQVTPREKDGTNPAGSENLVQASTAGDRITFMVPANMPGAVGSSNVPQFLATRAADGWSSSGLLAPSPPGVQDTLLGSSEDLSQSALEAQMASDSGPALYLRDNGSGSYRLAVPGLGGEPATSLAGFSADDSAIIFESAAPLLPNAAPERTNLYELRGGTLSLAGVLPSAEGGAAPPGGSFAGPYEWAIAPNTNIGGATRGYYTQNTISSDGSRIFFTAGETGRLYVREPDAGPARTLALSPGTAEWQAATPDGRYAFFTEAGELFRVDLGSEAPKPEALTAGSAAVQGVLGASADGSYVYFAANGVLASGASPGACSGINANRQTCSLYVWHNGTVTFVAPQSTVGPPHSGDANNWYPLHFNDEAKMSRLTPDGRTLLFVSHLRLTAYDNAGFDELYRFDATQPVSATNPACVSCNPTGAPAGVSPTLLVGIFTAKTTVGLPSLTRNLSDDGSRVFFETTEALLPQDTNGQLDVYMWERAGRGCTPGSSTYEQASGGCLYLISSGRSPDPSNFADASASGDDAFFFTSQPLVRSDEDQLLDIYDARVGGGIESQNAAPAEPCAGEACRPLPGTPPLFGAPASSTFSGAGDLAAVNPIQQAPALPKPKPLTRAQKLQRALHACRRLRNKRKRAACRRQANRRYGSPRRATSKRGAR